MNFGTLIGASSVLLTGLITCLTTLPFLAIALGFFYIWRRNNGQVRTGSGWPSVLGTIGKASVTAQTGAGADGFGTAYYPEVLYAYEVGGNHYLGQRINFGTPVGFGNRETAQSIANRYTPGSQVSVYYNPQNASDAVLERAPGIGGNVLMWIAIFILVMLCITVVPTMLFTLGMNSFLSAIPFVH